MPAYEHVFTSWPGLTDKVLTDLYRQGYHLKTINLSLAEFERPVLAAHAAVLELRRMKISCAEITGVMFHIPWVGLPPGLELPYRGWGLSAAERAQRRAKNES